MTPELSRRIARAIHHVPGGLSDDELVQLPGAVAGVDRFEDLPEWVRVLVERGESAVRARMEEQG